MWLKLDEVKCSADCNDGHTTHDNVHIFCSDPWHASALAVIDNVYILPVRATADCIGCSASNFARRMIMAEGRRLMRHHRHGHGL